jgi:predicted DNA-binding ribbon-helix-helix protein
MMRSMEARRRAPRRQGHRTTLTLPTSVLQAAERLARELSTTSNDAIVRLAEEGAAARERRGRIAAIAAARRAAVEQSDVADALPFPSAAEVREAMLSARKLG